MLRALGHLYRIAVLMVCSRFTRCTQENGELRIYKCRFRAAEAAAEDEEEVLSRCTLVDRACGLAHRARNAFSPPSLFLAKTVRTLPFLLDRQEGQSIDNCGSDTRCIALPYRSWLRRRTRKALSKGAREPTMTRFWRATSRMCSRSHGLPLASATRST